MQIKNKTKTDKSKGDKEEEEYIVEKIVSKKLIKGREMFEIKWVGWPSRYNTMEPLEHLTQASVLDMIAEFNSKNDTRGKKPDEYISPKLVKNKQQER